MKVKMYFKNILHLVVIVISSCLLIGCLADVLLKPGPTNTVNPIDWQKIKIGMSKEQVNRILGSYPSQHIRSVGDSDKSTVDFWEYNYRSSPLSGPHPKAYVVFFDEEGLVYELRAPIDDD